MEKVSAEGKKIIINCKIVILEIINENFQISEIFFSSAIQKEYIKTT